MKLCRYISAAALVLLLLATCFIQVVAQDTWEAALVTLTEDRENLTVTENTCLDLCGFSVTGTVNVAPGVTLQVKDSKTDDYTVEDGEGYGSLAAVTGDVVAADGYMLITESGKLSSHRLNLDTVSLSFRPEEVGVYYQSQFGGDEVVRRNIIAYGAAVGVDKAPTFAPKTYTRFTDLSAWQTGTDTQGNSKNLENGTLLRNIMAENKPMDANAGRADMKLCTQAYVELADGQRILGDAVSYSLRQILEGTEVLAGVEGSWDDLTPTQKTSLASMYKTFQPVLQPWYLPRITHAVTGIYELERSRDLTLLQEAPSGDFVLMNDLDAKDVEWTTPAAFSGSLAGNGHAISNLTVDAYTGSYTGMFSSIEAEGSVRDLHLENITVNAESPDLRFIGTLAGLNYGTVDNCTATGTISGAQTGTETAYVFVGALVGRAMDGSVTRGGTGLSVINKVKDVKGTEVTYSTTGLAAKVAMDFPDSPWVMRRLVGNYTSATTVSGIWQDLSFASYLKSEAEQQRRQKVVDYAYQCGTVKWTVPTGKAVTYYANEKAANGASSVHTQRFVPGTVYVGIPYAHSSSSLEQFRHYTASVNGNGVRMLNTEVANAGNAIWDSGQVGFSLYIGSDCSAALTMAWHKVSPILLSSKANGGVCLLYTNNMIPSEYNQYYYGLQKVGNYTVDDKAMSDGVSTGTYTVNGVTKSRYNVTTDDMVAQIIAKQGGVQTVYEAYARTKMGDMLLTSGTAGHARMAAQDAVVIRTAAGTIDGAKSYFVTHEQGDGLYERATTNSSWRINYRYYFRQLALQSTSGLARGSNGYYLPITMKAFETIDKNLNGYNDCSQVKDAKGNLIIDPASGGVNGYYRIQSTKLTIKDTSGKVVYEKLAFQGTNPEQVFRRAIPGKIPMYMATFFGDYGKDLQKGQTYTFTVEATNYLDVTNTLVDNEAFVYN